MENDKKYFWLLVITYSAVIMFLGYHLTEKDKEIKAAKEKIQRLEKQIQTK